jgi:Ca2+-binding RTX toxin-like protein
VIESTGALEVTAVAGDAVGIEWTSRIWNAGTLTVSSASGDAWGIANVNPLGLVVANSGTISVTAAGSAHGVSSSFNSYGVSHCVNSGVVDVQGSDQSYGVELVFSEDSWNPRPPSTFVNSGTIAVTDETPIMDSVGLRVHLAAQASVWNSGTITADFAVRVTSFTTGGYGAPYGTRVYNTGLLDGMVFLSKWDDVLVNTGTISGLISLGSGDDLYDGRGGSAGVVLEGYSGNDTVLGGSGSDTFDGGSGADTIGGGEGDDFLAGGAGRDSFRVEAGGGQDVIRDFTVGTGHDYIELSGPTDYTVTQDGADLVLAFSGGGSLRLLHVLLADFTTAMVLSDGLAIDPTAIPVAPASADPGVLLDGLDSSDTLTGGHGDDQVFGQAGNDVLLGSGGDDGLSGGLHADTLRGGRGIDFLEGDGGSDSLYGDEAGDSLLGGAGADTLSGGDGNDTLVGGLGRDVLQGGSGADQFVFSRVTETRTAGSDVIEGFDRRDKIDLSQLDGNPLLQGVQKLTYIGTGAFSPTDATGQVRVVVETGRVMVYGSTDADARAEFAIEVTGVKTLTWADFLF